MNLLLPNLVINGVTDMGLSSRTGWEDETAKLWNRLVNYGIWMTHKKGVSVGHKAL